MVNHDYSAQVALELLMRKLAERDPDLAAHVRAVVDQGKDVQETEAPTRGRTTKSRVYRKTVPYPYDEALSVALNALAAYFIEQPLIVDSCLDNMRKTAVGSPRGFRYAGSPEKSTLVGVIPGTEMRDKDVQIELRTETQLSPEIQLSPTIRETQPLHRADDGQIEQQRANLARLKALLDFRDN